MNDDSEEVWKSADYVVAWQCCRFDFFILNGSNLHLVTGGRVLHCLLTEFSEGVSQVPHGGSSS